MSRVVRRRALYLAPLIPVAVVLDLLDTFGVSWDDYAVLLSLVVSAEVGRRLVDRTRDPQRQVRIFEAFFAVEVLILAWAAWWMSFTRWLGPTALLLELGFANVALPPAAAIRITTLGIASHVGLVWAEVAGWVRSNRSFGLPSYAGYEEYAVVATAGGIVLLAFGAFAQREFAAIIAMQEAASRHREQLALLGRMAASVAHDVNNVLTAVHLTTDALDDPAADTAERAVATRDLRLAAERGQGLTRQLLAFAKSGDTPTAQADVVQVLMSLEPMLRRLAARRGTVTVRVSAERLIVPLDATRIEQIVTNLVVNALDAAPESARVRVEAAPCIGGRPGTPILGNGTPAAHALGEIAAGALGICLVVEDEGSGMSAAVLARVFEPFFTTKAEGQGTGLGLATVQTIAQSIGGGVRLATTPGVGTRVEVYLPAVPA